MFDFVLGIDPGATGALALRHCQEGRILKVWDMPHDTIKLTTGKNTNRINPTKLLVILEEVLEFLDEEQGDILHVHIEKVQAFGKQAAPAAFNFGYAACMPYAMLVTLCAHSYSLIEIIFVAPQTWKKQFNLLVTEKDEARLLVLRSFPEFSTILKFKYNVDRADAILLSLYQP